MSKKNNIFKLGLMIFVVFVVCGINFKLCVEAQQNPLNDIPECALCNYF